MPLLELWPVLITSLTITTCIAAYHCPTITLLPPLPNYYYPHYNTTNTPTITTTPSTTTLLP